MLGLRMSKGVCLTELKYFGYDLLLEKSNTIEIFKEHGLIDIKDDHIFITPENFGASNQIILELLP